MISAEALLRSRYDTGQLNNCEKASRFYEDNQVGFIVNKLSGAAEGIILYVIVYVDTGKPDALINRLRLSLSLAPNENMLLKFSKEGNSSPMQFLI